MESEDKFLLAEKSNDTGRTTCSYQLNLHMAQAWIGSCESFRITDTNTGTVIDERNAEIFDKSVFTAEELVANAKNNTILKKRFY